MEKLACLALLVLGLCAGCQRPGPQPQHPAGSVAEKVEADVKAEGRLAQLEEVEDRKEFAEWMQDHSVAEFEAYLAEVHLNGVLPTRQVLRTATDWQRCGAPRFEIPPQSHWKDVRAVLELVAELKQRGILKDVEGASGYRNPVLNACAGGAPKSSHTQAFALDLVGKPGQIDEAALCRFWQDEGRAWDMGLSRYPSGRIHLDVTGYRTWGADHTRKTSFCLSHSGRAG